ncbi:MAG: type II toxin-antitoxin system HicB family antitoxin [Defluviitaleaceae bacterium]|nr:type II toxin-antitoxin system HicB family antitoxin [Defluviitaleaceae bacterium]MCL2275724.1 type II toxin-antitoxin system HicB family antitoxin [Defluviitaleaceae bacterium]
MGAALALDHIPLYEVVIHKDEDGGYWASCEMTNGGANAMGDTVYETQRNMYESMALFLKDDYPHVQDFMLQFVIKQ